MHPKQQQRPYYGLIFACMAVLAILLLTKCGGDPPTAPGPPTTTTSVATTTTSVEAPPVPPTPPSDPPGLSDCEIVNLNQSTIRPRVGPRGSMPTLLINKLSFEFYAEMNPERGTPYIDLWLGDINTGGSPYARCQSGESCSVELPSYGRYEFRIAAETVDDRVYQCDRLWFAVEAKPPVVTTTVPTCEELYPPACEIVDFDVIKANRAVWVKAFYRVRNACAEIRILRNGDVVKKTTACSTTDVCSDVYGETKKLQYDLWWSKPADEFMHECEILQ